MKPNDICIGVTYVNRGAGRTTRTVLAIGDEYRPTEQQSEWYGRQSLKNEPGVLFEQKGKQFRLYLSAFASWAKGPVVEEEGKGDGE